MSDHIDFIITDIKKIVKPEKEKHFMSKNVKKQEKKSGSFQI